MNDSWRGPSAGFLAAVGFLTVVPVHTRWAEAGHQEATAYFPLVGLGLGSVALLCTRLPLPPYAGAVLAVGSIALLTGGLHWDGLADIMDAALAPGGAERRVRILHEPHVGAHAIWGVACVLALHVVALERTPPWAILLGATVSRWSMVMTLALARPLDGGVGARLRETARPLRATAWLLVVFAGGIPLGATGEAILSSFAVAVTAGALVAWALAGRFGGLGGDAHGATGLLVEAAFWLSAASLAGTAPGATRPAASLLRVS